VTASLADLATAVLLDPEVSAAQAVAAGVIPNHTGLVVAVEATGYGGAATARQSQILPGWSVEKAKRMGASMVKLLVYYHPDSPLASEIEAFVRQVADECTRLDLGLMLEPLSYSLVADKKLSSTEKRYVVIETARRLVLPGVDVLKAEFPLDVTEETDEKVWAEACAEVSAASPAPWIVLSAAVDYETYLRQVEVACRAGASGSAVGRAVWHEAVQLSGPERLDFLRTTGRERLVRLTALCSEVGKPVSDFYSADAPFDWYKTY
jgi:tagatose-1,6-bisphosphate aldolase